MKTDLNKDLANEHETIGADVRIYIFLCIFMFLFSLGITIGAVSTDKTKMIEAYIAFVGINMLSGLTCLAIYYGSKIDLYNEKLIYRNGWNKKNTVYYSSVEKWKVSNTYITAYGRSWPVLLLNIKLTGISAKYNAHINLKPYKKNDRDKILSYLPIPE